MRKWLILLVGGLCGTGARYLLAGTVYRWLGTGFPYGTLAVNTLGCLVIGFLSTLSDQKFLLKPESRLFWMVGLLGAFTTFSTFIYESWRLMQDGEFALAGTNLLGSLCLGLLALWFGHLIASWL
ncbi:MAG: fluoride efflux transporter CrcB [Candidatus Omnitrophica bacterium]|nr:fluoride efflux transporter CrcB [Candidatus Omnitrophota bacterium]